MDTPQNRTSELESLSRVHLILEIVPPQRTRGYLYEGAARPSLEGIRHQIKELEHVEKGLARRYGKDKNIMDSEEVRMMAKARAVKTGNSNADDEWHALEELHVLRLKLFALLNGSIPSRTAAHPS